MDLIKKGIVKEDSVLGKILKKDGKIDFSLRNNEAYFKGFKDGLAEAARLDKIRKGESKNE